MRFNGAELAGAFSCAPRLWTVCKQPKNSFLFLNFFKNILSLMAYRIYLHHIAHLIAPLPLARQRCSGATGMPHWSAEAVVCHGALTWPHLSRQTGWRQAGWRDRRYVLGPCRPPSPPPSHSFPPHPPRIERFPVRRQQPSPPTPQIWRFGGGEWGKCYPPFPKVFLPFFVRSTMYISSY